MTVAPAPAPTPVKAALPVYGQRPPWWRDKYIMSARASNRASVPLPWCTSKSTTRTREAAPRRAAAAAAAAATRLTSCVLVEVWRVEAGGG